MIQTIVEGDGEVIAVPVLLRRLILELGCYEEVGTPVLAKRTGITRQDKFMQAVQVASNKSGTRALLVLLDADDDCARDLIPQMTRWAQEAVPSLPCAVILARREYESWFLAAIESLRGRRRIRDDARYDRNPEEVRAAKGAVSRFMPPNKPYGETADQAALSAVSDLGQAYHGASSGRTWARSGHPGTLARRVNASGFGYEGSIIKVQFMGAVGMKKLDLGFAKLEKA